jgi:AcrR family transcriptional regulator
VPLKKPAKSIGPARRRTKRGKGRPPHDQVGRDTIIKLTRELLKFKPPSELTRVEIAAYCGIDPGLIRYYFGSTDELITEVAAEITDEMHARIKAVIAVGQTPREKLRSRVKASLEMHHQNPHLNSLIIQKILGGKRARARSARSAMIEDSLATLGALVKEGVQTGDFNPTDAKLLHIALIGMCDFFFTGRILVEELFGKADDPTLVSAYGDFIADLILSGITARAGVKAKPPQPA